MTPNAGEIEQDISDDDQDVTSNDDEEQQALFLPGPRLRPTKWTKSDKIILLLGCLIEFGDGIEIYLPGVWIHVGSIFSIVASAQCSVMID